MKQDHIVWAKTLAWLGAVPFVASVAAQFAGMAGYHTAYSSLTYGTVIISFLSGIHWGLYLSSGQHSSINLLVSSNVLAVVAWLSLVLLAPSVQYLVQGACFTVLLLIDARLVADGVIERWFYQLRKQVTLLVVLCLILVWIQR
jgi:hypothetical protein